MRLKRNFYKKDAVSLAKDLLGKVLYTKINNKTVSGIIVETEGYCGLIDRGSHAYGGKVTNRTKTFYMNPGTTYVYLCYGIHNLFNVICGENKNIPDAVLIRALEPYDGLDIIKKRRKTKSNGKILTSGPGVLSKALNIDMSFNELDLTKSKKIWIEDKGIKVNKVSKAKRIGIDFAGSDKNRLWRFFIKNSKFISKL
jgi:DNA-3-methyladenine glycosylase